VPQKVNADFAGGLDSGNSLKPLNSRPLQCELAVNDLWKTIKLPCACASTIRREEIKSPQVSDKNTRVKRVKYAF
jgi:hypothetical protein